MLFFVSTTTILRQCGSFTLLPTQKNCLQKIKKEKIIHLVEVVDGDNILGGLLIIGNAGVLKTVTPQDLIGKVGRPHLESNCFLGFSPTCYTWIVLPVSGVMPSTVRMISNCIFVEISRADTSYRGDSSSRIDRSTKDTLSNRFKIVLA